jgi:hypothetical protein
MPSLTRHLVCATLALAALSAPRLAAAACNAYQCGGNSPILFGQPLANLRLDGAAGTGGVELVPDSLTKVSRCLSGATMVAPDRRLRLTVVAGALVGVDPADPTVRCDGPSLVGAEFDVLVTPPLRAGTRLPPKPTKVTIRIAELGKIRTWLRDPKRRQVLPTYKFVVATAAETTDLFTPRKRKIKHPAGVPLCSNRLTYEDWQDFSGADALADREDLMAGTMAYPDRWTEPKDHALLIQGEAFTDDGSRAPGTAADPAWLNLACAATSLAKMRMLGVDPMDPNLPPGATAATLKMLGARYDGTRAETRPGTPVMWIRMWDTGKPTPAVGTDPAAAAAIDDVKFHGGPSDEMEPGPIEAGWDARGATCLSHFRPPMVIGNLRARRAGGYAGIVAANEANRVRSRQRALGKPPCDEAALPAGTLWVTVTVDHPVHSFSLPADFFVVGGARRSYLSGSVSEAIARKLPTFAGRLPIVAPPPLQVPPPTPIVKPPVVPIPPRPVPPPSGVK